MLALSLGVQPVFAEPDYPSATDVDRAAAGAESAARQEAALVAALAQAELHLEQVQQKLQIANEKFVQAQLELTARTEAAAVADRKADLAAVAATEAQDLLGRLAVQSYLNNQGLGGLEVMTGARTTAELVQSAVGFEVAQKLMDRSYDQATTARSQATQLRTRSDAAASQQRAATSSLGAARDQAQKLAEQAQLQSDQLRSAQQRAAEKLASLRRTSVALELDRQRGIAAAARERAERRAEQTTRARTEVSLTERASSNRSDDQRERPGSGGSSSSGAGRGRTAVDWAQTQIGKDYQWAATGPSTYDCSGLVLRAWERAGRSLPHSSREQYRVTERVSLSELQPGDLVFFGSNRSDPGSIYHVGIYLSSGRMVEAPYTGAQVRISSIYRSSLMGSGGRPG